MQHVQAQVVGAVTTLAGGNGTTTRGFADGIGTATMFGAPAGAAINAAATFALIVSRFPVEFLALS